MNKVLARLRELVGDVECRRPERVGKDRFMCERCPECTLLFSAEPLFEESESLITELVGALVVLRDAVVGEYRGGDRMYCRCSRGTIHITAWDRIPNHYGDEFRAQDIYLPFSERLHEALHVVAEVLDTGKGN